MKKIIGLMLVLALSLTCLTAFAAEEDIMLISEEDGIVPISEEFVPVVEVNGEILENATIKEDGTNVLIPLRAVCEKLGMTVNWDGAARLITVEKLPIFLTMSPDADGYTLARTAPIMLGTAPVLENGTTYVPASFVSEIMQGYLFVTEDKIAIFHGEEAEKTFAQGTVSEIIKDEDGKIAQFVLGDNELVLNVADAAFYSNVSDLTINDVAVGDTIKGIPTGIMTMSLPAQMPVYAVILNK